MEKNQICLVIGPIGADGSDTRRDADRLYSEVIEPTIREIRPNFLVFRPDHLNSPGDVNRQVILMLMSVELVICDMTGLNANAFYELAIRHSIGLPCIHMQSKGERLPFDVSTMRAMSYSFEDIEGSKLRLRLAAIDALASDYYPTNPILDALSSEDRDRSIIRPLPYEYWNKGRTNLVYFMSSVYAEFERKIDRKAPVQGNIEGFFRKAFERGTLFLAALSLYYDASETTHEMIADAASANNLLVNATGGKRMDPFSPGDNVRIFYDVIASEIADVNSFCQYMYEHHDVASTNFGVNPVPEIFKHYMIKSSYRNFGQANTS